MQCDAMWNRGEVYVRGGSEVGTGDGNVDGVHKFYGLLRAVSLWEMKVEFEFLAEFYTYKSRKNSSERKKQENTNEIRIWLVRRMLLNESLNDAQRKKS